MYPDLPAALHDRRLVIGTSARARDERTPLLNLPAAHAVLMPATAVVFGNEASGLSAEELDCCHQLLALDTPGDYPSYNLSHAVATTMGFLHHYDQPAQRQGHKEPASGERVADLEAYWLATLKRFDHFRRIGDERGTNDLHDLLRQLNLSDRDCVILRGMLAQFNYKAFGSKNPRE